MPFDYVRAQQMCKAVLFDYQRRNCPPTINKMSPQEIAAIPAARFQLEYEQAQATEVLGAAAILSGAYVAAQPATVDYAPAEIPPSPFHWGAQVPVPSFGASPDSRALPHVPPGVLFQPAPLDQVNCTTMDLGNSTSTTNCH